MADLLRGPAGQPEGGCAEDGGDGQPEQDRLDADRPVGVASVYADIQSIRYGKRCWLQGLVVTAAYRSRKVGRQLLASATEWARERGCTHLELASGADRTEAHRFYLREGMSQSYNFQWWIGE